jgi:hypothetical protein
VGTGRFWTMDSYDGNNEDPLSLHKYLYCQGNPISRIDPGGSADFTLASIGATMSEIGYMAANIGLRAAPALNRAVIVVFEATTGESIAIGGGAAITGYAAMSRVEGGIGTWAATYGKLKGFTFGPYGYVKSLVKGTSGQANHLNQSGAYPKMIKEAAGCIELDDNALLAGTEHNQFHQIMEEFFDRFREAHKFPTNKQYLSALRDALSSVIEDGTTVRKFTDDEVSAMVEFAEK